MISTLLLSLLKYTWLLPAQFIINTLLKYKQIQKINAQQFPEFFRYITEIDTQYPQLKINAQSFYIGAAPESLPGKIILQLPDIQAVESIYTKKKNEEELTEIEENTISILTWIILHEASHIKYNDVKKRQLIVGLYTIISNILTYAICTIAGYTETANMYYYYFGINYLIMLTTNIIVPEIIFGKVYRKQEYIADAFANKHADKKTLEGGIKFLEYSEAIINNQIQAQLLPSFIKKLLLQYKTNYSTHPSPQSRIKIINKTIQKRF